MRVLFPFVRAEYLCYIFIISPAPYIHFGIFALIEIIMYYLPCLFISLVRRCSASVIRIYWAVC
nr:MAG TPA_asm: hypothetical protein [Caudoviricetes sp.]